MSDKNIETVINAYNNFKAEFEKLSLAELWSLDQDDRYLSFAANNRKEIVGRIVYLYAKRENTSEAWNGLENYSDEMKNAENRFFGDNIDVIREAMNMAYKESELEAKAEFDSHNYYLPFEGWLEEPEFYNDPYLDETTCPCLSRESIEKTIAKLNADEPYAKMDYITILRWYFRPATEQEVEQRGVKE